MTTSAGPSIAAWKANAVAALGQDLAMDQAALTDAQAATAAAILGQFIQLAAPVIQAAAIAAIPGPEGAAVGALAAAGAQVEGASIAAGGGTPLSAAQTALAQQIAAVAASAIAAKKTS